jgi:hypothetical protein
MLPAVIGRRGFAVSCGLTIAVWLLLVGAYGYVAYNKIHELAPSLVVGVLGGTFAGMLVSSFIGLFTGNHDRQALKRAAAMEPMRDGRLEAASGPIRPTDKALATPFSGQSCVAFEYDIKQTAQGQSDYAGYAMAPSVVQTLRGPVRVLGWAMLDQFPHTPGNLIDRARGAQYLSSATFESMSAMGVISVFKDLLADDDGSIRKDLQIGGTGVNLQGRSIQERALPVGTPVTLLGHWSEARGGFVPAGGSMNRLFPGDLDATTKQVGGSAVKTFAIALFANVALHGILAPMYFLAPGNGRGGSTSGPVASVWDERDCDRQKTLLKAGANPNERGTDALTPLMNAAREGQPDCVRNLIAAGAHLEDRDKRSDTALMQAVSAGRDDNVTILLAAGAKEFRITKDTGRPIDDESAPLAAVKDYIAAVHRGDFETMARLMAHTSVKMMEDRRDDLPFWQSMRPKTFTVEEGWMTDDTATITIRGTTSRGERRVTYQLEKQSDGWQIRKEWFPDDH